MGTVPRNRVSHQRTNGLKIAVFTFLRYEQAACVSRRGLYDTFSPFVRSSATLKDLGKIQGIQMMNIEQLEAKAHAVGKAGGNMAFWLYLNQNTIAEAIKAKPKDCTESVYVALLAAWREGSESKKEDVS